VWQLQQYMTALTHDPTSTLFEDVIVWPAGIQVVTRTTSGSYAGSSNQRSPIEWKRSKNGPGAGRSIEEGQEEEQVPSQDYRKDKKEICHQ
ncbi:hypothetical protein MRX96_053703, partial [Rhipicephalus microplus]